MHALHTPSLIDSVSDHFPPTAFCRPHSQTVRNSPSIYKIEYVIVMQNFLNPKEHQNRIIGSEVMAILLKGWMLPIMGVALVR